jgi:hypothetical protein
MLSRLISWEIKQASRFIPKDASTPPMWVLHAFPVVLLIGLGFALWT